MNIETIDDIVEDIANKLGVYGACKSNSSDGCDNDDDFCCRVGFAMILKERIYTAIENENKLKQAELI